MSLVTRISDIRNSRYCRFVIYYFLSVRGIMVKNFHNTANCFINMKLVTVSSFKIFIRKFKRATNLCFVIDDVSSFYEWIGLTKAFISMFNEPVRSWSRILNKKQQNICKKGFATLSKSNSENEKEAKSNK